VKGKKPNAGEPAMILAFQPSIAETAEAAFYPSLQNPAVALCTEVWQKIHDATLKQTKSPYTAERCAGKAYRMAMPPLSGYQNICDFIACAGYGMLIGAIKEETGTKLLYAAQVALTTVPREAKSPGRSDPPPPRLLPHGKENE
jgi:hypothetical protein